MLIKFEENGLSSSIMNPVTSLNGRYTCFFEGLIVNKKGLAGQLEKAGIYLEDASDTTLVLALYMFSGAALTELLQGEFVVVIIDHEEKTLWATRDVYGIGALYYQLMPSGVWLTTRLSLLKPVDGWSMEELNFDHLMHYFSCGYVPENETFLCHIHHLPAGCTLFFDWQEETVQIAPYDELKIIERGGQPVIDEQLLKEAVKDAVYARIASLENAGLIHEGDVSSDVLYGLAKSAGAQIRRIVATFDGRKISDELRADDILNMPISPQAYFDGTLFALKTLGLPLACPTMPVRYLLSTLAHRHIETLLSTVGTTAFFNTPLKNGLKPWKKSPIFSKKAHIQLFKIPPANWGQLVANLTGDLSDLSKDGQQATKELNLTLKGQQLAFMRPVNHQFGILGKYPFLDETILRLARYFTKNQAKNGALLKGAFSSLLKEHRGLQDCTTLKPPLAAWLRGPLYEQVKTVFERPTVDLFFHQEMLFNMLEIHRKRLKDCSQQLWAIVVFILWLEESIL